MTREIVLDTETTGIDPADGHRVVEIGCVELEGLMPTGNTFHVYINPQRDMPNGAYEVHGLSAEFLSGFPVFSEHAEAFIEFIGDAPLVIHNASFDMKFLNAELGMLGRPLLPPGRAIDTLAMARKAYPGAQNSLDALCRRFGIDNTSRTLHGALLDSELLAEVYLELKGGRQPGRASTLPRRGVARKPVAARPRVAAQRRGMTAMLPRPSRAAIFRCRPQTGAVTRHFCATSKNRSGRSMGLRPPIRTSGHHPPRPVDQAAVSSPPAAPTPSPRSLGLLSRLRKLKGLSSSGG